MARSSEIKERISEYEYDFWIRKIQDQLCYRQMPETVEWLLHQVKVAEARYRGWPIPKMPRKKKLKRA